MPEYDLDIDDDMSDEEIAAAVREQTNPGSTPRGLRRKLESTLRERDEARTALAAKDDLAREVAFLKAGINTDDPKMKYFVKGYEGDTTVDAVREAAVEAGLIANVTDPALSEAQKAAQVSVGAETRPPGSGSGPEWQTNEAEYHAELAKTTSQAEAMAVMDKYGSPRVTEVI